MATIGQQLTSPEAGWKRIDDTAPEITYEGTWNKTPSGAPNSHNGSYTYSTTVGDKIKFFFKGTKLRIIGQRLSNKSSNIPVKIDGVDAGTYSQFGGASTEAYILLYEKIGLQDKVHMVEITVPSGNPVQVMFDAIDIDAVGDVRIPSSKFLFSLDDGSIYTISETATSMKVFTSQTESNFINHGIDKSKVIDLLSPMESKTFFETNANVLGNGKVFRRTIDTSKITIKKVTIQ